MPYLDERIGFQNGGSQGPDRSVEVRIPEHLRYGYGEIAYQERGEVPVVQDFVLHLSDVPYRGQSQPVGDPAQDMRLGIQPEVVAVLPVNSFQQGGKLRLRYLFRRHRIPHFDTP
jgi:hypothetical protein